MNFSYSRILPVSQSIYQTLTSPAKSSQPRQLMRQFYKTQFSSERHDTGSQS